MRVLFSSMNGLIWDMNESLFFVSPEEIPEDDTLSKTQGWVLIVLSDYEKSNSSFKVSVQLTIWNEIIY